MDQIHNFKYIYKIKISYEVYHLMVLYEHQLLVLKYVKPESVSAIIELLSCVSMNLRGHIHTHVCMHT